MHILLINIYYSTYNIEMLMHGYLFTTEHEVLCHEQRVTIHTLRLIL